MPVTENQKMEMTSKFLIGDRGSSLRLGLEMGMGREGSSFQIHSFKTATIRANDEYRTFRDEDERWVGLWFVRGGRWRSARRDGWCWGMETERNLNWERIYRIILLRVSWEYDLRIIREYMYSILPSFIPFARSHRRKVKFHRPTDWRTPFPTSRSNFATQRFIIILDYVMMHFVL